MSIYYLDFENGNDASDGTTWANAWKTFYSGATAARIAPGDTIRIAKSPDPTSLGECTFTHASTITIPSGLIKNVDMCESGWAAAANVTPTHIASSSYGVEGTNCIRLSVATAFTTGLAGYKALGAVTDFSAYEKLSFYIRTGSTVTAQMRVCLCSDVAGATPVDEFVVTGGMANIGQYFTLARTGGGALSNSIQSVALYFDTDPGGITVYLDDIIACGDGTAAADIHLLSMIGINDGEWYGIRSINDQTVVVEGGAQRGYAGETTTQTGYRRESVFFTGNSGSTTRWFTVQDSGSSGSPITFSGGWNTATTERDGYTFVRCRAYGGTDNTEGIYVNGKTYISFEYIGLHRFPETGGGAWYLGGAGQVIQLNHCYAVANAGGGIEWMPNISRELWASWSDIHCNGNSYANADYAGAGNCGITFWGAAASVRLYNAVLTDIYCIGNGGAGFALKGAGWVKVTNLVASHNGSYQDNSGVHLDAYCSDNLFLNLVTDHNYYAGIYQSIECGAINTVRKFESHGNVNWGGVVNYAGLLYLWQADIADSSTVVGASVFGAQVFCDQVHSGKYKQVQHSTGNAQLQSTVKYGDTGMAWQLSISDTAHLYHPARVLLGVFALQSGVQRVLRWYARRAATNVTARIICPGYQIAGMDTDIVSTITVGADTWEELSLTLQSTADGAVEVWGEGYGSSAMVAGTVYFDQLH